MERFSGIYAVRCIATGKMYVGSSRHLARRLDEHRRLLRRGWHPYQRLQRAWNEVGEGGFTFEVLEVVEENKADLGAQELFWMNRVNRQSPGSLVNDGAPRPHVSHARPAWTERDSEAQREAMIARPGALIAQHEGRAALRGRGRLRDWEAAREAFLNAGQEVFAQLGFSGARIDDIARVAGYNKALLFHYFTDKLGLYRAVISRIKQQLFEELDGAIERFALASNEVPTRKALMSFITESFHWVFDYYAAHPEMAQMLAWEAAEGWQTFVSCAPLSADMSRIEHVKAYLLRAQQAGVLRPELDAELLIGTMMRLPLSHLTSLSRYVLLSPVSDFTSPEARAQSREHPLALLLHGTLTIPEEN